MSLGFDIATILVSMRGMFALRRTLRAHGSLALLALSSACSQDWSDRGDAATQDSSEPSPLDAGATSSADGVSLNIIDGSVYALVDGKWVPAVVNGVSLSLVDGAVVGVEDGAVVSAVVDGAVVSVVDGMVTASQSDAAGPQPVTCGATQCQHGGTCSVISNVPTCSCPAQWTGSSCELDADECQGAHGCPAGHACENLWGGYTCAGEMADFLLPRTNTTRAAGDFMVDGASRTVLDTLTGLRWELGYGASRVSFTSAQQACAALETLGHRDWRLPSYVELLTLVSGTSIRDRAVPNMSFSDVWTSSPLPGTTGVAYFWDWHSELTDVHEEAKPLDAFVRCVRRETPKCVFSPSTRFKVMNALVYDQCTKLTWQQLPSTAKFTAATAAPFCASLTTANLTWRLPTYLELISTLDVARASSRTIATASAYFANADECFLSSTPISQPEATAPAQRPLTAMLSNGDVWRDGPPVEGCLVRCVSDSPL